MRQRSVLLAKRGQVQVRHADVLGHQVRRRYRMLADPLDASEREPVRWPYTNDNKPRL